MSTLTSPGRYLHSADFPALLQDLRASLFVTTYQAGKLIVVRAGPGHLCSLVRSLDQPMGVACDGGRLAIGTRGQIWFWHDAPILRLSSMPLAVTMPVWCPVPAT